MTEHGVGAWSQDYENKIPMMGLEGGRVMWAVASIQTELQLNGLDPGVVDGEFGPRTEMAVRAFQQLKALQSDGVVGPVTARALCQLRIKTVANSMSVSPTYLGGIIRVESAYDFGAVGYVDVNDRGLAQINSVAHPTVTDEQAFTSKYSITWACKELRGGMLKFTDIQCAIASYNLGLGGAATWCKDKTANQAAMNYVMNVMKGP